jgi:acyl-[acyl carrier protein]--UDP-N-acetylglucosamine O-acyltransferase
MRFTIPALNNEYYDEDYLRVFGFPRMGKNVRVHRSVVFKLPSNVSIGDDVTIGPFCVFDEGRIKIEDGVTIKAGCYFEGKVLIDVGAVLGPNGSWIGDPVKKKKTVVETEEDDEDE